MSGKSEKAMKSPKNKSRYKNSGKNIPKVKDPNIFINGFYSNADLTNLTTNISGLQSFSVHYSPVYNKIIYLLGETHNYEELCDTYNNMIPADEFFMMLLNSRVDGKTVKKDIFIESMYDAEIMDKKARFYGVSSDESNGYMVKVFHKLRSEGCLVSGSEDCSYYKQDIRFHSTDVRTTNVNIINYLSIIRLIKDYYLTSPERMEPFIYELINKYFDKGYDDYKTFLNEMYKALYLTKSEKQILNVDPKYTAIRRILTEAFENNIKEQFQIYKPSELKKLIIAYMEHRVANLPITYEDFRSRFPILSNTFTLDTIIMDVYTIGRIFRKFAHTSRAGHPSEPTNIIIYTGNQHTIFYKNLLSNLNFNKLYEALNMDKMCLKLTNFKIRWICYEAIEDSSSSCILPSKLNKNLSSWTMFNVIQWIDSISHALSENNNTIHSIKELIYVNKITGKKLIDINDSHELINIGIIPGAAVRLFNQIQFLKIQLNSAG